MKHQKIIKRISVFILSIIIVSISCLSYFVPVYAVEKTYTSWSDFRDDVTASVFYLCSQIGAVVQDHSFVTYIQNKDEWENYWNEDNVVIDEETNEITFSSDLVSYIKQALKEYQQEQYGYQILPTLKYDQIPVSSFGNATAYRSMCELVKTYGYLFVQPMSNWLVVQDVSPYYDGTAGFYVTKYYDNGDVGVQLADFISWDYARVNRYYYHGVLDDVCSTFEELEEAINNSDDTSSFTSVDKNIFITTSSNPVIGNASTGDMRLVSYSGSKVLVFNSLASLENYSVDKRGVFTTSGFYEDTGALTVSIDDLNNSIGELTDLLDKFKDLIGEQGNGLTEEQLEALLEKFLDEFFNRLGDNDGGDDNNGGGGSSGGSDIDIPSGFFDSIAGYCNSVLVYLESILLEIQNLEWLTWESSVDEEHSDLFDMFDKIWDDPENGSQEVSDELSASFSDLATGITKKFPFSIPWDVYALFTVFADVDPPQTQSLSSYGLQTYSIQSGDIQPLSNSDMEEHDAPYFELPIVLESYGINESIKVDLEPFSPISTLSRTMLSLLFGVFLMKFTIKVIDLFKGGTDS